jgi:hypothetical protein
MMLRKLTLFSTAILLALQAFALKPQGPDQFDYVMPLQISKDHPVYELLLPLEVYRGVAQSNLADIRVFNSTNQVVPHALYQQTASTRDKQKSVSLPFFPIYKVSKEQNGNIELTVRKDAKGSLVKLKTSDAASKKEKTLAYYLFDASQLKDQAVHSIKIQWARVGKGGLYAVELQGSDNLNQWTTLMKDSLSDISYQGKTITNDLLYTRGTQYLYYRLKFDARTFAITKVDAHTLHNEVVSRVKSRTTLVKGEKLELPEHQEYVEFRYDLGGFLPIHQIRVSLPEGNFFARAHVWGIKVAEEIHDPTAEQLRHSLWNGQLIKISLNNKTTQLNSIHLPTQYQHYRFLIVRFYGAHTTGLKQAPQLTLQWVPRRLIFLAQGKGPYKIAFGHPDLDNSEFDFIGLTELIESQAGKKLQPVLIKHGKATRQTAQRVLEEEDTGASNWVLWAVLILGVGILGFMALAIRNQLRSANQDDSSLD